jgi:hypothetical protein
MSKAPLKIVVAEPQPVAVPPGREKLIAAIAQAEEAKAVEAELRERKRAIRGAGYTSRAALDEARAAHKAAQGAHGVAMAGSAGVNAPGVSALAEAVKAARAALLGAEDHAEAMTHALATIETALDGAQRETTRLQERAMTASAEISNALHNELAVLIQRQLQEHKAKLAAAVVFANALRNDPTTPTPDLENMDCRSFNPAQVGANYYQWRQA